MIYKHKNKLGLSDRPFCLTPLADGRLFKWYHENNRQEHITDVGKMIKCYHIAGFGKMVCAQAALPMAAYTGHVAKACVV
ncbi:MAG: hypothetical protein V4553_10715 [Bacteroidota bacterium]